MISRIQAAAMLIASACLASDDLKPACDASTAGQLGPEAANHDSKLRKKFSRCGELEVCTLTRRHYHWELITVRIDQLRGGAALSKPAGCEAADATQEEAPAASGASAPGR
jgi:hypothetical protein